MPRVTGDQVFCPHINSSCPSAIVRMSWNTDSQLCIPRSLSGVSVCFGPGEDEQRRAIIC